MLHPPASPLPEPPAGDGRGGTAAPRDGDLPLPAEPSPDDAALDFWLRRELRRLHDAVLSEPIPDHLLRILTEGR